MKKILLLPAIALTLITSCDDDSTSNEFDNANGGVAKKLIEKIEYDTAQIGQEDYIFTVNYDANNRVTSASNGIDTGVLVYDNNDLATVTGGTQPFSIDELYQSPYDVFEEGDVVSYDQSGNPSVITVIEYSYDYDPVTQLYIETIEELTATISYDATPNPFFYTFEAAGLIAVMDRVQLNFSMLPQSPEIVKAKALFPVNNLKSITVKNESGDTVGELKIDYVYDAENYPTSATFTAISEGETTIQTAKYFYKQ